MHSGSSAPAVNWVSAQLSLRSAWKLINWAARASAGLNLISKLQPAAQSVLERASAVVSRRKSAATTHLAHIFCTRLKWVAATCPSQELWPSGPNKLLLTHSTECKKNVGRKRVCAFLQMRSWYCARRRRTCGKFNCPVAANSVCVPP